LGGIVRAIPFVPPSNSKPISPPGGKRECVRGGERGRKIASEASVDEKGRRKERKRISYEKCCIEFRSLRLHIMSPVIL